MPLAAPVPGATLSIAAGGQAYRSTVRAGHLGTSRQYSEHDGHITHLYGDSEPATLDALEALVEELDDAHDEHPDVSVSDESEWTLSAYGEGLLVWENVAEDDEPRHMKGLSREDVLEHFRTLVQGDLDPIHALPWSPGYG